MAIRGHTSVLDMDKHHVSNHDYLPGTFQHAFEIPAGHMVACCGVATMSDAFAIIKAHTPGLHEDPLEGYPEGYDELIVWKDADGEEDDMDEVLYRYCQSYNFRVAAYNSAKEGKTTLADSLAKRMHPITV